MKQHTEPKPRTTAERHPPDGVCSQCEAAGHSCVRLSERAAEQSGDTGLLCGAGCGCRVGTEDADRRDCACDGPCCWDSWDDYIADVLNRPDYYDELRVARGLPSALAALPSAEQP